MQLKDCLSQNEELRGVLFKMRMEQANMLSSGDREILKSSTEHKSNGINGTGSQIYTTEVLSLKVSIWG